MTKEIEIYYEKDSIVLSHFWKSFFEACGIFVKEYLLTDDVLLEDFNVPKLLLLGDIYNETLLSEKENIFYITENSKYVQNNRKNILLVKPNIHSLSLFEKKEVIRYLFQDEKDFNTIEILLQIYYDNNLWAISWLFSQFASSSKSIFDNEIKNTCFNTLEEIKNIKKQKISNIENWNIKYFEIYIEYIFTLINNPKPHARVPILDELIERIDELAETKGHTPSLLLLSEKVIEKNPIMPKFAIRYYVELLKYNFTPEILYNIGLLCEDFLFQDKAIEYFKKASNTNCNHYLSLFKVASHLQIEKKWKEALANYNKIIELIKEENIYVSINTIKCLYDTYKKRFAIYSRYFDYEELINSQRNVINNFTSNNEIYDKLAPLLLNMFGEDMFIERKKCIINEINKKL